MKKKDLKKILDICNRILTADEISVYEINLDYLIGDYITCAPPDNLLELRRTIRSRILNGENPRFFGKQLTGTNIFDFEISEVFEIVYLRTLDEVLSLADFDSELYLLVFDTLCKNGQYHPVYSIDKYKEFLSNMKKELKAIINIVETLDKNE